MACRIIGKQADIYINEKMRYIKTYDFSFLKTYIKYKAISSLDQPMYLLLLITKQLQAAELFISKDGFCSILTPPSVTKEEEINKKNQEATLQNPKNFSEEDEDPMLSDEPQKKNDRSQLKNPTIVQEESTIETSRSLNNIFIEMLQNAQPIQYQEVQIQEDDMFLYAIQQRNMRNNPSTEVLRLEANRISGYFLTDLCSTHNSPQICGKYLRGYLEILPQLYDSNQQIMCSGIRIKKSHLDDPTGQQKYTEQHQQEIGVAVENIRTDLTDVNASIFVALPQYQNGCLVGGYTQNIYQRLKDTLREQNISVKNKPSIHTTTIELMVRDQKRHWEISIKNAETKHIYHRFLIPNDILGEDVSIGNCLSKEQRAFNIGFKEYQNATTKLGLSVQIPQKGQNMLCASDTIDIEVAMQQTNMSPNVSFQLIWILENPNGQNIFMPLSNMSQQSTHTTDHLSDTSNMIWQTLLKEEHIETSLYLPTSASSLALVAIPSYQNLSLTQPCYTTTTLPDIFPNFDFAYTHRNITVYDINNASCSDQYHSSFEKTTSPIDAAKQKHIHALSQCPF